MKSPLVVHSNVTTALKRGILLRGTVLAALGVGIFLFSVLFLPVETLKSWGLPLWLIGGGCITWGLLPYRRLTRRELNPDSLVMNDQDLQYHVKGKCVLSIPLNSLESIEFITHKSIYGIGVTLKQPIPDKIIVLDPRFDIEAFQNNSHLRYGCDLFFPYFSHRAHKHTMAFLNAENQKDERDEKDEKDVK